MNNFAGKKVLCFIALPHHNRFLVPIMESLGRVGMDTVYFTTPAEGSFEITLNQAHLPYRNVMDYATSETKHRVAAAFRELRPQLQEKMLRNRILQSVPIVIQDKTIRSAVENLYCMDRMLEVEKPDLLLALHELNPWGKILGYLSHVHRVPYFTLQEGLYYSDIHYYRFHTDFSTACMVWGEECRQILLTAGCSDDKIFPLGNTHIWNAKKEYTKTATVLDTRRALAIGPDKKVILFLMSHSHYQPFQPEDFLRWMRKRGDAVAVFKWHPATGKEIIDRALEKVRGNPAIISVNDIDTYALIAASEVCITVGNSTTGLEALVFGKPLIEVRLPDQEYSYSALGVAEAAVGFEEIGAKVEAVLSQGLSPERKEKVANYLAGNFAYQDSETLSRIVDLVGESLGAKAAPERAPLASGANDRFPCTIVLPLDDSPLEAVLSTLEGISAHTAPELFETLLVDCSSRAEVGALLAGLEGDVRVVAGQPDWSYADACNRAASEARGKYLVFLKPGLAVCPGWLDGLLKTVEEKPGIGVVGGQLLDKTGLLLQVGVAFDVNQSPFSLYRMLPPEFPGASRQRDFRAVALPFLAPRELICRVGGFNLSLRNRLEDIDLCLKIGQEGLRIVYTPTSKIVRQRPAWQPTAGQDRLNCIRFHSTWTGSLWQDDERYLQEDGLTHDALSAHYRELAGRVAEGARSVVLDSTAPLA